MAAGARLRALGFSQGVSTICRWAALGQSRPAAMILWAGEIPGDLPATQLRERFGSVAVHLVAGIRDRLVPQALVTLQEARLRDAGIDARVHRFDGGHRLDNLVLALLASE
jgi:predicted esterase